MSKGSGGNPALGVVFQFIAIPCNFLAGFLTGVIAPVAAIAAMVAGVRLFTGKIPFLGQVTEDAEAQRRLSLQLVPPDQVGPLFAEHKRTFGDDLGKLRAEIQAVAQKAKSQGDTEEAR